MLSKLDRENLKIKLEILYESITDRIECSKSYVSGGGGVSRVKPALVVAALVLFMAFRTFQKGINMTFPRKNTMSNSSSMYSRNAVGLRGAATTTSSSQYNRGPYQPLQYPQQQQYGQTATSYRQQPPQQQAYNPYNQNNAQQTTNQYNPYNTQQQSYGQQQQQNSYYNQNSQVGTNNQYNQQQQQPYNSYGQTSQTVMSTQQQQQQQQQQTMQYGQSNSYYNPNTNSQQQQPQPQQSSSSYGNSVQYTNNNNNNQMMNNNPYNTAGNTMNQGSASSQYGQYNNAQYNNGQQGMSMGQFNTGTAAAATGTTGSYNSVSMGQYGRPR